MRRVLRNDGGFGLVELVIAMTVLSIGVLALIAGFTSGYLALNRASKQATAAALADSQMEKYRALPYSSIGLTWTGTDEDATYTNDAACTDVGTAVYGSSAVTCDTHTGSSNGATYATCGTTGAACKTVQASVTGPDGRSYRVDTFVRFQTTSNGRQGKLVTVVARDSSLKELARVQSTFDKCTGLTSSDTTACAS